MYQGKFVLAIIMAKTESDRIPYKNTLMLDFCDGKSLQELAEEYVFESASSKGGYVDAKLVTGRGLDPNLSPDIADTAREVVLNECPRADIVCVIQMDHVVRRQTLNELIKIFMADPQVTELRTVNELGRSTGAVRIYDRKALLQEKNTNQLSRHITVVNWGPQLDIHTQKDFETARMWYIDSVNEGKAKLEKKVEE